ncbi:hypothetical protein [Oscillatoria acuminata]|uniref:Uncharacterized protein n=1 Tax=Oscillatoria acuminata PCC 6304 TaxID=56110 RepID=K9TK14_9CYAN|nr:hypothetical protein [Oscillatoria acuminata]AFY82875.1 hypothetical protein Oscil6304_3300 [Oscillatoria acuminata PCC 6304]
MNPSDKYGQLMWTIRYRFDLINILRQSSVEPFIQAESAAFHGRKIVEGIAFACLVGIENSSTEIPKKTTGQWNAEKIFKQLQSKHLNAFPSPAYIRQPTPEQKSAGSTGIIQNIPERRLTPDELIKIYQGFHRWLHELNPYSHKGKSDFYEKNCTNLWRDLERLHLFIECHLIGIKGKAFLCVLWDSVSHQTQVIGLSKK